MRAPSGGTLQVPPRWGAPLLQGAIVNEETERYLRGKSTGGLLVYAENTWGCRLALAVDVTWFEGSQAKAQCTVTVPNAIHRLELNDPPNVQRTTRLNAGRDLGAFINGTIIDWLKLLEEHLDNTNR